MGKLALNNSLQKINEVRVLKDFSLSIRHDMKPQRIPNLEDGFYAPPRSDLLQNSKVALDLFFDEMPGLSLGRQEARHQVLFGRLGSLAVSGLEQLVAVKQSSKPEQLMGELAMLQYIQDKTPFPTFRPVAYLAEEQENYLFTEFKPDIQVIGMFDWLHANDDQKKAVIAEISNGLGRLHANFLYHGDAFTRNLALNSRNKFFIVDPELMTSAQDIIKKIDYADISSEQNGQILGQLLRPMIVDVSNFYKSVIAVAYKNQIKSNQQTLSFIKSIILPSYKIGLENGTNIKNLDLVRELYSNLDETLDQRAEQEIL